LRQTKPLAPEVKPSLGLPWPKRRPRVGSTTDRPRTIKTYAALLPSEQEALKSVAATFQKALTYKPDARLVLSGHADKRGPAGYNKDLSERRAQLAKKFLIEQGVPAGSVETQAYGEEKNLDADQVKQLLEGNPDLSAEVREKALQKLPTIVLANNRRVDITLSTTGEESARQYPFMSEDFALLADRNGPEKKGGVELAAEREKTKN